MELTTQYPPQSPRPSDEFNGENHTLVDVVNAKAVVLLVRSHKEAPVSFGTILAIATSLILLGVLVNVVICFVMFGGKRYRRNNSNFFILHLSLTELFFRLLIFPIVVYSLTVTSEMQIAQCKFLTFFTSTFGSVTFVNLAAIAFDRYKNIAHPIQAVKSKRKPVQLVFLVWLYATIVSGPTVFIVKSISIKNIPEAQGMVCENCLDKKICDIPQDKMGQVSTILYFLLAFFVPLFAIFLLYTKIALILRQRGHNGMMHKLAAKSKSKAVRMLIITVFGYLVSLGPSVLLAMLRSYGVFNNASFNVMLLVSWIVELTIYTSSLGNPLIYAYYNRPSPSIALHEGPKELNNYCRT